LSSGVFRKETKNCPCNGKKREADEYSLSHWFAFKNLKGDLRQPDINRSNKQVGQAQDLRVGLYQDFHSDQAKFMNSFVLFFAQVGEGKAKYGKIVQPSVDYVQNLFIID